MEFHQMVIVVVIDAGLCDMFAGWIDRSVGESEEVRSNVGMLTSHSTDDHSRFLGRKLIPQFWVPLLPALIVSTDLFCTERHVCSVSRGWRGWKAAAVFKTGSGNDSWALHKPWMQVQMCRRYASPQQFILGVPQNAAVDLLTKVFFR